MCTETINRYGLGRKDRAGPNRTANGFLVAMTPRKPQRLVEEAPKSLVPARLLGALDPFYCYVRLRRPDGTEKLIKVDGEQWERVVQLAQGEFADPSIDLGG